MTLRASLENALRGWINAELNARKKKSEADRAVYLQQEAERLRDCGLSELQKVAGVGSNVPERFISLSVVDVGTVVVQLAFQDGKTSARIISVEQA